MNGPDSQATVRLMIVLNLLVAGCISMGMRYVGFSVPLSVLVFALVGIVLPYGVERYLWRHRRIRLGWGVLGAVLLYLLLLIGTT